MHVNVRGIGVITVPELSSNLIDVVPESTDQTQVKGANGLQSFADLFASAKAAAGKPAGKPVAEQDRADTTGLPKKGVVTTPSSTESTPTEIAASTETESTPATPQKVAVEENQNPSDPKPPAKAEAFHRTRDEAITDAMKETHAVPSEKVAPEEQDAPSIKLAGSDSENSDPGKAAGKDRGIHTKAAHKLDLLAASTAEVNPASVQLNVPEPTSKTPMTAADLHQAAVISADVNTLSATQGVVSKNTPSTTATARSSFGFAAVAGRRPLASLAGEEVTAGGQKDESREKTIDHRATMDEQVKITTDDQNKVTAGEQSKVTTYDQHNLSSALIGAATSAQTMDAPGASGLKVTQALQQTISQPLIHSVSPAAPKVTAPGNTDIPSSLRHVQSNANTANPPGPIRILSERAIEVSVSDSQHGSVSVRAEMRNDGSVAALLLPQSEAGHQSLVSQTNGLSAFLSEHSPSVSVSVVAPTTSTGGNPPAGNSSGQTQSDGMQFTQHREEREPQAQRSQSEEEFSYGATANQRGEESTWEIAQTSTTQQTERHGWISIHV